MLVTGCPPPLAGQPYAFSPVSRGYACRLLMPLVTATLVQKSKAPPAGNAEGKIMT